MTDSDSVFLREVARDIREYYFFKDLPYPDDVSVPADSIVENEDGSHYKWRAAVFYITDTGFAKKVHRVDIRFNLDDHGRFDPDSSKYVFD